MARPPTKASTERSRASKKDVSARELALGEKTEQIVRNAKLITKKRY